VIERPGLTMVARGKEVVVVGAGDAGRLIVQEMQRSRMLNYTPIGFIDDDPRKRHTRILGVRVLGTIDELPRVLREHRPDEVLIAMPSVSGDVRRRIIEPAQQLRIVVKTLPGLYELIAGDLGLAGQIRPVQVEDVLGREQVEVDFNDVAGYLEGHTVLVTGAGGSIGSELCRQIARVRPSRLILVDNAEGPLFEIERELVSERDFTAALTKLIDVKDRKALRREVFEKYQPTVVFHAAAYKHVAMLETHPLESVRNNVVGTRVLVELAAEFGVERFVFVSTDKAVNPKTVMGQSKALCEWVVESFGHRRDVATRFVAVRFGNVLNSSGSVIPIFRKQIERGGPVTVTHPEMTRYFMTIPEAVSLVVQAGAIGGRGQVFVLDMGDPVRIIDLAQNMIRLSGKEPRLPDDPATSSRDVRIVFTGSKPGEKRHEELWSKDESVGATTHPKILRLSRPPVDPDWLSEQLAELERLADEGDTLEVVGKLRNVVREPKRLGPPVPGESSVEPATVDDLLPPPRFKVDAAD
jgi:FlaA1/EpsC-like NDP-sugar epimerase